MDAKLFLDLTLNTAWGIALIVSVIMFLFGGHLSTNRQKKLKQVVVLVFSFLLAAIGVFKDQALSFAALEAIIIMTVKAAALQTFAYEAIKNTGLKDLVLRK